MIKTINFSEFCDAFSKSDTYKNNFTYEGKRALFEYLEEMEENTGDPVEFDIIALCCEYSEYESAYEASLVYDFKMEYEKENEKELTVDEVEATALKYLEYQTQVITFDGGIIIADF